MARQKAPAWTAQEIAILNDVYPAEGVNGAADALPDRSWRAIYVMASKLGLRSTALPPAPEPKLKGDALEQAIRLREEQGWSFERIGVQFGVSESGARNAVMIALCTRKGFRPAERDATGRLLPEGFERLRYALRKGYKAIDIQLRLGLSAERVAEERRRYNRELKARGKALLPAPGGGEAYSGVKLSRDAKQSVEQLFQQGFGTKKIHEKTGVSHTSIVRIRTRLVARLKREGIALPGCDLDGNRHKQADSTRFISPAQRASLRKKLMEGMPVRRAAKLCGIGACSAYRIRNEFQADLAAVGQSLPAPKLPGRLSPLALEYRATEGIPSEKLYRYRELVRLHGEDEARKPLRQEIAAEKAVPLTFEQQLERVRNGARLIEKFTARPLDSEITLGGVATGTL